jgi:hypothetical protein
MVVLRGDLLDCAGWLHDDSAALTLPAASSSASGRAVGSGVAPTDAQCRAQRHFVEGQLLLTADQKRTQVLKAVLHSKCLDKAAAVAVAQPVQTLSDCSVVHGSGGSSWKSVGEVDPSVDDSSRGWQVIAGTAKPRFLPGTGKAVVTAGCAGQQPSNSGGSNFRNTAKAIVEDVQRMLATTGNVSSSTS